MKKAIPVRKKRYQSFLQKQNYNTIEHPGPGSYDIQLPFIKPNYEAIRKNNDVIILKVNAHSQSANFKSSSERFPAEKKISPGPAHYSTDQQKNEKEIGKKANQRYFDLMQFMNKDRSKQEPIPNYTVEHNEQLITNIKLIKNSYRRHKNSQNQAKNKSTGKEKSSRLSHHSIISIKSNHKDDDRQDELKKYATLDYEREKKVQKDEGKSAEEEDRLMFHRKTMFNRNMLAMMLVKGRGK